jgi:putative hydrolase of the HAD superfamily
VLRGIVFDGDDTLWRTEALYDEARQRAREIVAGAGLDGARWETLERAIDVENVTRLGHSAERFPTSCMEAYDALCAERDRVPDLEVRAAIGAAARSVFERPAELMPHARETLEALRSRGFRLALLTKGDSDVQRRRIEQSGLADLFDLVQIVASKTPDVVAAVVQRLGVPLDTALSVGNSVRSDVLPALAAGVQPIWIDAHVWEWEREHGGLPEDGVVEVASLARVLDVAS